MEPKLTDEMRGLGNAQVIRYISLHEPFHQAVLLTQHSRLRCINIPPKAGVDFIHQRGAGACLESQQNLAFSPCDSSLAAVMSRHI